jgi:hypothetical protein
MEEEQEEVKKLKSFLVTWYVAAWFVLWILVNTRLHKKLELSLFAWIVAVWFVQQVLVDTRLHKKLELFMFIWCVATWFVLWFLVDITLHLTNCEYDYLVWCFPGFTNIIRIIFHKKHNYPTSKLFLQYSWEGWKAGQAWLPSGRGPWEARTWF